MSGSWASIVSSERVRTQALPAELMDSLDDSRDGINLLLKKQSLQQEQQQDKEERDGSFQDQKQSHQPPKAAWSWAAASQQAKFKSSATIASAKSGVNSARPGLKVVTTINKPSSTTLTMKNCTKPTDEAKATTGLWSELLKQKKQQQVPAVQDLQSSGIDAEANSRKRGASEISHASSQGQTRQLKQQQKQPSMGSPYRKQGKTCTSPLVARRPPPLDLAHHVQAEASMSLSKHNEEDATSNADGPKDMQLSTPAGSEAHESFGGRFMPSEPSPEARVFSTLPSEVPAISSWADDADREDDGSELESWMNSSVSGSETDRLSNPSQLPKQPIEDLTPARIAQRQKQIDFGKSTEGYQNYILKVKIEDRGEDERKYPVTPRTDEKISKRFFDYKLKKWRRALHRWDPVSHLNSTQAKKSTGGSIKSSSSIVKGTVKKTGSLSAKFAHNNGVAIGSASGSAESAKKSPTAVKSDVPALDSFPPLAAQ